MTENTETKISQADLLSALDDAVMHDGGTSYNGDEDEIGIRGCCYVLSYKPHAADCWMGKMSRIRTTVAALIEREAALAERVKALEAERATLEEEWFICYHPAWPDPLSCRNRADAVRTIIAHPHPDAWILRRLKGARVEYKGVELAEMIARAEARND